MMINFAFGACRSAANAEAFITVYAEDVHCETKPVRAGECVFLPADAGEWRLRGLVTALLCYLGESIA
mgnify:CR=1 FL=1